MRVGRAALDEEAIRLIEEHNPEVEFDWTRILKGQPVEEPQPPPQKQRPRRERSEKFEKSEGAEKFEMAKTAGTSEVLELEPERFETLKEESERASEAERAEEAGEESEQPEAVGSSEDFDAPEPADAGRGADPAQRRLGAEGLLRLRARFAEVLARITERIQDPVQREQLKAQAERLNPDTWVTDEEVSRGLEEYETVFASLRAAVGGGSRRRRRRRPGGGAAPTSENAPQPPDAGDGGEADAADRPADE